MVRPEKITEVETLTQKMRESDALVLADFTGLSVADVSELRFKCREKGVEFRVVKNRLAKRAAVAADVDPLEQLLTGPTGIAFGFDGPVDPAKVLVDFAKTHEALSIKGAYLDGEVLTPNQVQDLSNLPTRDELLAMIARGVQAPVTNFVGVMYAVVRNLAGVMDAIAKQKAEEA